VYHASLAAAADAITREGPMAAAVALPPGAPRAILFTMRLWLLLPLVFAGCGLNGAQQLYPGASVYESPRHDFHLHYLQPPWRQAKAESGKLLHLAVDNFGQFQSSDKAMTHQLWVSYVPGSNAQQAIAGLVTEATQAGRAITVDAAQVACLTGERGWQLFAQKDQAAGRFYFREVVFPSSAGNLVRLSLTAFYPLDEQDIDDLVRSFSAGSDPGTDAPPRNPDAGVTREARGQ
jgi:hypothetical protein